MSSLAIPGKKLSTEVKISEQIPTFSGRGAVLPSSSAPGSLSARFPPIINSSIPLTPPPSSLSLPSPIPRPSVHLRANRRLPPFRQASSRFLAASPSLLLVVASAAPTDGLDYRILLHRASLRPATQLRHRSHSQSYLGKL